MQLAGNLSQMDKEHTYVLAEDGEGNGADGVLPEGDRVVTWDPEAEFDVGELLEKQGK